MQPKSPKDLYYSQSATRSASGMTCPFCSKLIPISISQLLQAGSVTCPHCEKMLSLNRQESKKALDALKKVEEAVREVEKAPMKFVEIEKFKR